MAAELKIKIRRHDGTRDEVTIADAILIYERRLAEAQNDVERAHCESRIAELRARWKKALGGKVERAPSEAPTRPPRKRR